MWLLVIGGLYVYADPFNELDWRDAWIGDIMITSAIVMTIIRWIVIGKHIWNRP